MDLLLIILSLIAAGVLVLLLASAMLLINQDKFPKWKRYDSEKYFTDPKTGGKHLFPSLWDEPSVDLSVVVPAYNEEDRLTPMMEDCLSYLKNQDKLTYEIIIVSDGSKDRTASVANKFVNSYGTDKTRLLDLEKNRGKGGAVRLGVLSSRGKSILFADADGATKFADLAKLKECLETLGPDGIVCGSRAHLEDDSIASRSFFRTVLMWGFHFLVWLFTVRGVRDTQCGFKLFTRSAARKVFPSLHIERWAFDVELLYIAQKLKIPIGEVAVTWTEIEGSKVTPVLSWIQMGIDLFAIWLRYSTGRWQLVTDKKDN